MHSFASAGADLTAVEKQQAENCFGTWLYTYVLGTTGSGPASSSVSLFWGSFTAGRLLAIPISASIAPGTILLASLPLAIAGPCIILLGARVGTVALLYAGAMAAGLGISTGFANSVSLLSRYVPPTGTVQAAIQVAATLGSMTFPPAVALIAQRGVFGVRGSNHVSLHAIQSLIARSPSGGGIPLCCECARGTRRAPRAAAAGRGQTESG